ncbi:ABC transporter substrate-binding protein [Lacrimispora sp.]|uniref:ABC transporter substrate-binding protein n=1 Tax=Lacrimispora sp. TaxID=2719234 RepID=UPI0028A6A433|nr:sugar ABC transporter substrate-binding protein [Lacrimispora sp.]
MKLRKIAALGLAGITAASLAACGGGSGSAGATAAGTTAAGTTAAAAQTNTAASAEPVTIKVSLWDYSNTAYYPIMVEAFEKSHPNIKVDIVEFSAAEYSDTIVVKMGAKEKYDVVFMKGLPEMSALIAGGHLQPLTDRITGFDMKPYGGAEKSLSLNGVVYGLPFRTDNNMIFYNKDLFDKAGVQYPKDGMTMEEYRELAKKMTSGDGAEKVYGSHVHTWPSNVYQYSRFIDEFNYLDTSTYEKLKPYYETILGMQNEDKSVQDYGELKTGNIHYSGVFYNEQVAMLQIGSWYIEMLTGNVTPQSEHYFKWGAVTMPNSKGNTYENMVGGITPCSIGAYSEHPEEAWEFLSYVCGEEGAKVIAERGIVPGWKGQSILDIFDKIPEQFPNAPEELSKFLTPPNYIVEQPMDPNAKAINTVIEEMHSDIMTNSVSIDDGIKTAIERAKEAGAK